MPEDQSPETTDSTSVSAAAVSDGAYTLLVADFSDTDLAWQVLGNLGVTP